MKNLLVYLNPKKDFDDLYHRYAKIQIDNSLFYWKPEDIIITTNFPYQYHGIKSLVVPDNLICDFDEKACKINAVIYLLEKGILTETTWYHDFEAFQISPINVKLDRDLGLTDYGWKEKWNTGSFFFKPEALDIFRCLRDEVCKYKANEEPILWNLYRHDLNSIRSRCQKMNITYNLGKRNIDDNLAIADKPLSVVHFHPYQRKARLERFRALMPESLTKLIYKNRYV